MKIAFLFSGQGSQYPGMGKELYDHSQGVRDLFSEASELLGYDVAKLMFEGTPEELSVTKVSQPLIYTMSMAAFTVLKEAGIAPAAVAGHSLGEYAALTAAEVLPRDMAFRLLEQRGMAMEDCSSRIPGAMCAVMSGDGGLLNEVCGKISGYVIPVNYNSNAQTVLAGDPAAIQAVIGILGEQGIKCIPLKVSGAFHSKLMTEGAQAYAATAEVLSPIFSPATAAFYSNITGGKLDRFAQTGQDFTDGLSYLVKHITSPVRFTEELAAMKADGVDTFVECGPGKTLSSFVKRTIKGVKICNVEDMKSLDKTLAELS